MTWLRSTMGSGRLCNLARMHMHSDILDEVSNEDILKAFVQKNDEFLNLEAVLLKLIIIFC